MLISLRSCQLNTPNSVCVYIHMHCVTYRSLDHMPPLHNHRTLALMLSLYYIFILRWGGMLWNTTLNTHSPAFIDSAFVIDHHWRLYMPSSSWASAFSPHSTRLSQREKREWAKKRATSDCSPLSSIFIFIYVDTRLLFIIHLSHSNRIYTLSIPSSFLSVGVNLGVFGLLSVVLLLTDSTPSIPFSVEVSSST